MLEKLAVGDESAGQALAEIGLLEGCEGSPDLRVSHGTPRIRRGISGRPSGPADH